MAETKIKVSAPMVNPHICYISREYNQKIKDIKKETGMSLYNLLCVCSGYSLNSKDIILKFKKRIRKKGFKTIGEWAECLIDMLHVDLENINTIDLSSIELEKKEEK